MRTVVHIDLDAFYAAVEALLHPEYRGKPLIVGADPDVGRGVVATCSYEARAYGVRSAMPITQARRLCPQAIFVRPDMKTYARYSRLFHETLSEFSPLVESLSVDEAFIDMTGCEHFYRSPVHMAEAIKTRVQERTGLHASVGVAPNKFLAKLASDSGKPGGLVVISPGEVQAFLDPLPVERLWGVGPKAAARLKALGIARVRDLRQRDREWLSVHFGSNLAEHLVRVAHGIDDRRVEPFSEAKSMSREITFDQDVDDMETLRATLARLSAEVGMRLRAWGRWARRVFIKVRTYDFRTVTRQRALVPPAHDDDRLFNEALALLNEVAPTVPVRLIGVGVADFTDVRQDSLFDSDRRSERISETLDLINRRLGSRALRRGREIPPRPTRPRRE